jgi:hypothetical protein
MTKIVLEQAQPEPHDFRHVTRELKKGMESSTTDMVSIAMAASSYEKAHHIHDCM